MLKLLGYLLTGQWNRFKAEIGLINAAYIDYPAALNLNGTNLAPNVNGVIIASAAAITITTAISTVSGTTNVTTIKLPTGFRGMFVIIPTGALPLVSGGAYVASDGTVETIPIKVSKTGAAGVPILCISDGNFVFVCLSA